MKELSIEEKAKRYDEALERAKGAHNSAKSDKENGVTDKITEYTIQLAETIFPELKVSDDERIRKSLIELFHDTVSNDEIFSDYGLDKTEVLAWLEKQGNNANKVKSIFEVGKWIVANVSKYTFLLKRGAPRFQAEGTNGDIYSFYLLPNGEKEYHLWSIEDAKDGDVLVASDKSIFIYDGSINENGNVGFHIALTKDMSVILNSDDGCGWEEKDSCYPATKEQRDLLFQKMKEAGYEWNKDKKELIKL